MVKLARLMDVVEILDRDLPTGGTGPFLRFQTGMAAPSPSHIIQVHRSQVATVSFSKDNERIYSGDVTGTVVVTSTRSLRSIAAWKAHSDGILGVEEWLPCIITYVVICDLLLIRVEEILTILFL